MENNKNHILIVDDDDRIRNLLKDYLSENNYIVSSAENSIQAKERLLYLKFDIIILDVMMPGQNGYELTKEIKKQFKVPIILLTAKGEVENRIKGLELGADDYVVKPFSPKELEARIRCVLRRIDKEQIPGMPNSGLILVTDIKIDTNRRQVFKSDERIRLTGMEFSLLELLVSRSGEPFSRGEILKEVWGYTPERHVDTRVVDVHISRLRSKLEADPANPELILTARGTGYLFQRIVDISPFDPK